ncbi:MAG: SRPBCC family protein [Bryobacteraceae bacterium]
MPTFQKSVLVNAPIETVFGFHEREDALRLLSPAFPPLKVLRKEGGLEPGSVVELQIGPIHWVARHSAFVKNTFFEDRQESGPFAQWIHRHEFEAVGHSTRLTDRVEYRLPGGVLVNRLLGWMVNVGLIQMFRERHRATKRYCEGDLT